MLHLTKGRRATAHLGRASFLYLAGGLPACLVVAVAGEPVRGWLLVGLLSASLGPGIVGVRRTRNGPATFLLLGTALLVPAYVLWYPAKLEWDLQLGDPAVTDWFFLGAYAAFAGGLTRLIRLRSSSDRQVNLLDSLIISVGLGVLVWVVFISPYLQDEQMSLPAKAVAVSYTLVDLLLLGAVVRMLFQGQISSTGDWLLTAWVAAQLSADLLYSVTTLRGTFSLAGPAPVLYCISFVLLGAALLHPTTFAAERRAAVVRPVSGVPRLAMLGSAALVAPSVLVVQGLRGESQDVPVVASLSAVLFGLVLLRVYLLMADVQEHRRIQERLQRAIDDERRQAVENRALLTTLRERQMLAERLFRIQRKISTRAPCRTCSTR